MNSNGQTTTRHETWTKFRKAVRSFWGSRERGKAVLLCSVLVGFLLAINGLNVLNSYVGRDFVSAIEHKNRHAFFTYAWLYLGVFGLSTFVAVIYRYAEERLGLLWRDWQTREVLTTYLDRRTFYHLEETGLVPNPDQRIAEDIRTFTTTTVSFALMVLNGTITVIAFSGVLWSISPRLFVVAVAYASVGTLFTVLLGKRLVRLNHQQLDKEANFRSELIHVRDHAEGVALFHREGRLKTRLTERLDDVVANFRRMISVNLNVGFFTTGYSYLIQILPALVVAPLFMDGNIEFGVITQSAMAFAQLMGAFSLIVTQFQSISSYAAVIGRLGKLSEAIETLHSTENPVAIRETVGQVRYENVSLNRPGDGVVVRDLNVTVERGRRMLIMAVSGYAKMSLFHATAGLDCEGKGVIHRPDADRMLFLPQYPYLPKGTLRDVLLSSPHEDAKDEEIIAVLSQLRIQSVAELYGGLHVERDWKNLLSIHEQAALAVARALLAGPEFVFLDRMSVAMNAAEASEVLGLFTRKGFGYLVLGGPDDDLGLFDSVLTIGRDGTWTLRNVGA